MVLPGGCDMQQPAESVTELLIRWSDGDASASEALVPFVLPKLRQLAASYMRRERSGHLLGITALVNEAWLRLEIDHTQLTWTNRIHFFAIAARIMRYILVDYARSRDSVKHGGGIQPLALDEALIVSDDRAEEYLNLDEALQKLAQIDPRKSRVVELRFFGGMNVEETAHVLQVSPNTIMRDWKLARAWLRREMSHSQEHGQGALA